MTITIKTRLHSGIYKLEGGGEIRTHYEFATGPRNLLKAIETLWEHRASMERGYGNIGCGRSWLEVDGIKVRDYDLQMVSQDDRETYGSDAPAGMIESRTAKARNLLANISSGEYVRFCEQHDTAMDAYWDSLGDDVE